MSHEAKVIERIRKLLALSKSSNEHEAATAAARATELMAEHQIAQAQLDMNTETDPIGEYVLERGKRAVSWKVILSTALMRAFACDSIQGRRKSGVVMVIVGRQSNVAAVRYMYAYLVAELERLAAQGWRAARDRRSGARSWKNSFRVNAAAVIARRLKEARKHAMDEARADPQNTLALTKIDKYAEELAAYMSQYQNLHRRVVRVYDHGGAGAAGRRAGRSVNLGNNPALGSPAPQLSA